MVTYYGAKQNFLRFAPDPVTMEVIVLSAKDEREYGAQPMKYAETENGAYVNLRLPLKQLKINKLSGRVRVFPVSTRIGADGKTYLCFSVKEATNRPVRSKKAPNSPPNTPPQDQAANK